MITDFITMLQGAGLSFTTIDAAPAMEPIENMMEARPALYVLGGDESGGESNRDIGVMQRVEKEIICFVICDATTRETYTTELRDVAIGWQPDATHDVMEFASGSPIRIDGSVMAWQDTFLISGYISSS